MYNLAGECLHTFISELKFVQRMDIDIRRDVYFVSNEGNRIAEIARVLRVLLDTNEIVYLECDIFQTMDFDEHLDCYRIESKDEPLRYILLSDLEEVDQVYKAFEIDDKKYIILREIN